VANTMADMMRLLLFVLISIHLIELVSSGCHPLKFNGNVHLKCHNTLRLIPDNTTMHFLDIREEHIIHEINIGEPLLSASTTAVATEMKGCIPVRFEEKLYVKCGTTMRLIADKATFTQLGLNEYQIAHEYDLKMGAPVPAMDGQFVNYDHWIEINVMKFGVLSGPRPLLQNFTQLGMCSNPSLASWKEDYILFCREAWKTYGGSLLLGWVDNQTRLLNKDKELYGIGPGIHNVSTKLVFGEDFRVFKVNASTYMLTYTGEWQQYGLKAMCRIKYVYMTMDDSIQGFRFSQQRGLIPPGSKQPYDEKECEKNWIPFEYNGQIHLILNVPMMQTVSIQPLTATENYTYWDRAVDLGTSHNHNIAWSYGTIRGGTPALRLNNNTNLAFMHCKGTLAPSNKVTYWMGAYLFSYHPPFTLKAISHVPIADMSLYSGAWYPSAVNRYYDYVVYPMSFVFLDEMFDPLAECNRECLREQWLLLSIGTQDIMAVTAKINLLDLLDSLVEIQ
jgi:hypothetical protein